MQTHTHRHVASALILTVAAIALPLVADAQVIGSFRWRTEPYCNVLTLTVTQIGSTFTLDGFDEQCGGNPRLPVHGIGVPQPNGTITFGLSVVNSPGNVLPVNLEAVISPATISGSWRDSAGSNGAFTFNPAGTTGGPRPGAIAPGGGTTIPTAISLLSDGGFRAEGTFGTGNIPDNGPGTKMIWYPGKAAFRAGQVTNPLWDDGNIGTHSAAFGLDTAAVGLWSFTFGNASGAFGAASIGGGYGSTANGFASVALGDGVSAGGPGTVALGSFVNANAEGAFVFGDRSSLTPVQAVGSNTFTVRAGAGVRFFSSSQTANNSPGVVLASGGGSWINASDVNLKEHFRDLDGETVLSKLAQMSIREWSYKSQDTSIRHAGPTAQEFRAAFGLGESSVGINSIDVDGIALRAIQALEARTRAANEELQHVNESLRTELGMLRERLGRLEAKKP
jgi:hypothetical protein